MVKGVTHEEPKWLVLARGELGEKEVPGPKSNERILEYRKMGHCALGGDDGDVPWCAIFVNAMLESAGVAGSRSAAARSFASNKNFVGLKDPIPGSICVISRPGASWSGHVFFVTGADAKYIEGIGGNQGDMVCVSRFQKSRLVGYFWPRGVPVPPYAKSQLAGAALTDGNEA